VFFCLESKGCRIIKFGFGAHPTKITPLFTIFVFGKQPSLKGDGDESEQSDDGEAQQLAAEEAASKERKRAGLPEICPDTLNSSWKTPAFSKHSEP